MSRAAAVLMLLSLAVPLKAQDLPKEALSVDFSGYFDSFDVNIVYPSVSLTKHVGERTAITGRYLVDVISAASMRSLFVVDGVSSATSAREGGGDNSPDELRQEVALGLTRVLGRVVVGVDGIYSREHDYSSATVAARLAVPIALRNTVLEVGLVKSEDRIFPQRRSWRKPKRVLTVTTGVTQILGRRSLAKAIASFTRSSGFLSDPYQAVNVFTEPAAQTVEVVHPGLRNRWAMGLEARHKVASNTVWDASYRYYLDDWEVRSHTGSLGWSRTVGKGLDLRASVRGYTQSAASFFSARYSELDPWRTVDTKLDRLRSIEVAGRLAVGGEALSSVPLLGTFFSDRSSMVFRVGAYVRHSATPNWHSRQRTLYAYLATVGYRFEF